MITLIRKVEPAELDGAFLWDFDTYQCYHNMWVNRNGQWSQERTHVVRQWSDEKKLHITGALARIITEGGHVFGAFAEERLVGFAVLDRGYGGLREQYMNLSMLFVDFRYKRRGVGSYLFTECVKAAAGLGGEKLFISAIPAEETVAFYFAMGCVDAEETIEKWVDMPFDRCLEFTITGYEIMPKPEPKPAVEERPAVEEPPAPEEKPQDEPEPKDGAKPESAPETKTEGKSDEKEKSAAGSVLRKRRRRNRGSQGRRGQSGAEQ